ncbi:uncharacterized protein [Epargyreus clarus]|uniref:uncharacterized protein n=1 Tax=Epargyreus clarus TaxID=520877 RepID=UPI003C2AACFB
MDVNTLFKFIKPYDGNRECLNSFIINCNNAFELASDIQKPILLKYILCQLEGKAELACSIKEFQNWDQLRDFLKSQFSDRKHYSHLLTNLQESRQGQHESVSQYSLKIETCLSQLLTESSLSKYKRSEVLGRNAAMEDLALHYLIMGPKPNLSLILRCKTPKNLGEAISIAIGEERIMQSTFNRQQQQQSRSSENVKQTSFRRPFISKYPNSNNNNNNQKLICRYCKNIGHTIDQCRKREYFNNRNHPSTSSYRPQPRVNFVAEDETNDYGRDEVDIPKN